MDKVLEFLASSFEESHHLEFYLLWTQKLLMAHGQKLKARYGASLCASGTPSLRQLAFGDRKGCFTCRTACRGASAQHSGHLPSRAGKLLPALQFLQKSIQRHLDAVSKLYVSPVHAVGRVGGAVPAGCTPGLLPGACDLGTKAPALQVAVVSPLLSSSYLARPTVGLECGRRRAEPNRSEGTELSWGSPHPLAPGSFFTVRALPGASLEGFTT